MSADNPLVGALRSASHALMGHLHCPRGCRECAESNQIDALVEALERVPRAWLVELADAVGHNPSTEADFDASLLLRVLAGGDA